MTAYGAVISLKNTIEYIRHSSHFSLVGHSTEIIQDAYRELQPLLKILERLDGTSKSRSRKKVNGLDGRIKERVWEFEDLLESLLSQQILSQFQGQDGGIKETVLESLPSQQIQFQSPALDQLDWTGRRRRPVHKHLQSRRKSHASQSRVGGERDALLFSIDLQCLRGDVVSFICALKVMEMEYIRELDNMAEDKECISSSIGFGGTNSKMIGLSDVLERVKSYLMLERWESEADALVGMAGVGKTTLAMEIFQDPEILSHFEHRAWVTVGRTPQLDQLRRGILAQLFGDEEIGDYFKERSEDKTCLIVLDDVWEIEVFESLMKMMRDMRNRGIHILVTARELNAIDSVKFTVAIKELRFLNEEESKDLLCDKVFGDEICPPQLDKAATKIANHCEGLPLLIVTVADFLSKSQNRDPDYWNDVAEERNSVFTDAHNQISKVLFPSYDYLPQYLKMPFLFMGVFPPDYEIPLSKIINMLTAEGWFHETKIINMLTAEGWYEKKKQSLEEYVWQCLEKLCTHKFLVLFNYKSIFWDPVKVNNENQGRHFKTCWLHSSWRHLCKGEARKNKFYHVLKKLVDASEEDVKGQRCLCLQNNLLFSIIEFYDSVKLNCASSTRSLLFFGPYHQYPIPMDVGFTLLRELDALKLRFYTFPTEILTLVQLKYLALTCNGELPTTISKLFNLRGLIIHPHINIKCYGDPSYVPIQVWDMQELEHIEILGKSLPPPNHAAASLEKLTTLVGVNASICTISELSRRIPNIRKLGVEIELTPYDDHNDLLSCFGCISTLESLKTLKCSIINPVLEFVPATPCSLMLPCGLKKLHLSGMGFPWEYMDVIGSLPYLQVLKLRSYAFRGSKWEAQEGGFLRLEFLLIEDTDLVCFNLRSGSFPQFWYLSLKHCYKLKEIHWLSPEVFLRKIEIVDCNPLVLGWANQLQLSSHFAYLDVIASSTFEEKPMTIKLQRSYSDDMDTYKDDGEDWRDYALDTYEDDDEDTDEDDDDELTTRSFRRLR